jgi:ATP-dependent helicase/nuclease subunit A
MQLTPSQQQALAIDRHICVTAGAGSGKTTVLVDRYLKILRESNTEPQEIVAITFTEKAAAEMKERVIEELSPQEKDDRSEQDNSLHGFRDKMSTAHISTIHAFCSRILREFPFQAGVPANFSILQGIDQKLSLQQTIRETLKDIATNSNDRHRAELTRLLQRYGGQKTLVDFFSTMINQREVVERLMQDIYGERSEAEIRESWKQGMLTELMSLVDATEFTRCLNAVLQVARGKKAEAAKNLKQQLDEQYKLNANSPEVLNLFKEIAKLITTGKGDIATSGFLPKSIDRVEIADEIDFLVSTAKKIKNTPTLEKNDDKEEDLETDDDFLISTTFDLLAIYERIATDYQTAKLSQGKLDFTDLQLRTRDLLRNNKEIRQALIERHKYFMVDEYQDTNELQYELVMLLTDQLKAANLFIVGDPKQSIYAFRGADVRVFEKTKQNIIDDGGRDVRLTENFRSLRDPVGFVNYFFNHLMGDGKETEFEVQYEALTQARPVETNGAIEILVGKHNEDVVDEYTLIAQHIKNMRRNQVTISERDKSGAEVERPIDYGDIAILIRSRRHLPDIEHALLEADIPHLTTGGVGFYQRQEIYDIWNYLNFLNNPKENQTSLAAVLRGPAFGISDTELYEISLQEEEKNFWDKAQKYQSHSDNLRTAIGILERHHRLAHRMPVNQLIVTIVKETGMIGTLKTGKQGQQRWSNYQKLLELARNFDGEENKRILPHFIEFLDILITEEPQEGQAPIEGSRDAVKIMTIHAAKGLQFPIVILPRLDRGAQTDREPYIDEAFGIGFSPLNPDDGYRKTGPEIVAHIKNRGSAKETAEKKRLLYVGATRAEDRLILSGTLSEKGEAQHMLKWFDTHLRICAGGNNLPSLPFKLNVLRQLEESPSTDETLDGITPVEFPECLPSELKSSGISAAFSVTELANYARCPLRYQLENVLRIPTNKQGEADLDKDELDNAIRYTLTRIRQQSDTDNLDTIINQTAENYSEATSNLTTLLHTSTNNFINSELGETALSASETHTNQQVHADIEGHIIDGRFDRLFKDETQHWQVINYKTDDAQDSDVYDPEMELYSLLLHRRYPEQPTVTMNLFFTEQDRYIQKCFNAVELQEAKEKWQQKISDLQQGKYNKNLDHCCSCPYADPDGQCIITEGANQ